MFYIKLPLFQDEACYILFWLEVPVDNAEAVKMVESQRQLSQVKLDILLREHHLTQTYNVYTSHIVGAA